MVKRTPEQRADPPLADNGYEQAAALVGRLLPQLDAVVADGGLVR